MLAILSFLEEEVSMAYNKRYFRIDKPKAINVRTVCDIKDYFLGGKFMKH